MFPADFVSIGLFLIFVLLVNVLLIFGVIPFLLCGISSLRLSGTYHRLEVGCLHSLLGSLAELCCLEWQEALADKVIVSLMFVH
jgi:hypothetical protein